MYVERAKEISDMRTTTAPKKPGALPPFALYVQEERPKMQAEHPDITFGEISRMLGEAWRSLEVKRIIVTEIGFY